MLIENLDSQARSAFVYNSNDHNMWIGLASKPLQSQEQWNYTPPSNSTNLYIVLFKRDPGGGSIMAGACAGNDKIFSFNGWGVGLRSL
jgi:hypothetical protein